MVVGQSLSIQSIAYSPKSLRPQAGSGVAVQARRWGWAGRQNSLPAHNRKNKWKPLSKSKQKPLAGRQDKPMEQAETVQSVKLTNGGR